MIIEMKRDIFDMLDDEEALGTACVNPIIEAYKDIQTGGGDFAAGLFQELSKGQQALFVFRALYNHVMKSAGHFYWWSAYFMAQPGRWTGLKNGLRFFGDVSTLQVLEDMEGVLVQRGHPVSLDHFGVSAEDLDRDPALRSAVSDLYDRLQRTVSDTHRLIGSYIRNNPHDFVQLEQA